MGKDINQQDEKGETELFKAVSSGDFNAVKKLLATGADPCIRNYQKSSALTLATIKGHKEIAGLLKEAELDSNCKQQWSTNTQTVIDTAPNDNYYSNNQYVSKPPGSANTINKESTRNVQYTDPVLPKVFFFLALLCIVCSSIFAAIFWPGTMDTSYPNKTAAYFMSSIWIISGIIEAALFSAIGQGLLYLHKIHENTSQ